MSPLATLLSRGKEDQVEGMDVPDLGSQRTFVVPRVNLLPAEIAEAEKFRREQIVRAGAVAAALVVVGLGVVSASSSVTSAQNELDVAQQRSTVLAAEVAALADVPATALQLQTVQTQRTGALGNEVRWSEYLNNLGLLAPSGTQITSMALSQTVDAPPATAAAGTSAGPLSATGAPGIASVTFEGIAKSNQAVAFFLESLAKQKANIDPYFTSATAEVDGASEREVVAFNASVTVDDQAKSGRYTSGG